jgi:hypothetical protein
MRTARKFIDAGFYVTQGVAYKDPISGNHREIDLEALGGIMLEQGKRLFGVTLRVSVECKSTKGKPWVAFFGQPTPFNFSQYPYFLSRNGRGLLDFALVLERATAGELSIPSPSPGDFPEAYAVAVGFRDPNENDLAYAALKSVTAAANPRSNPENSFEAFENYLVLKDNIPIVVIDQPLFLASLGDNGEILIEQVSAVVARIGDSPNRERAFILTEAFLSTFLTELQTQFKAFEQSYQKLPQDERDEIWTKLTASLTAQSDEPNDR